MLVPRVKILAAAVLFSTGGMAVKSCSLTGWQVAAFRSGTAALVMLLLLPAARRLWSWRSAAVGVAYSSTMICFILANKATTAANVTFLQGTAPIYTLLLAPWLLGERLRRRDALLTAVMAAGLAMFFFDRPAATSSAPAPLHGNLIACLAGASWALTVIGLRWLARPAPARPAAARQSAATAVVAGNTFVFLVCLPMALPVAASQPADWLWIGYLGVFQVAVAYILLTTAIGAVPAIEASLLLLAEPLCNPFWAWWSHGEVPGLWAVAGGVLILVVTAAKSCLDSRSPPARP
ncbi:MAG: EamA family transporter [bacterium]|nr:EamA family transporter [bacterium]